MTTIHLDSDIAAALKAGQITYPEAHQLRDVRREMAKLNRRMTTLQKKLDPLDVEFNRLTDIADEIEGKMAPVEE